MAVRKKTEEPTLWGEPDLEEALRRVNDRYFQFSELPCIVWSRGVVKGRYRKLTLGTYHIRKNQIKIHPILKTEDPARVLLDFVVYHEMLHYEDREMLLKRSGKRRRVHGTSFKNREKAYPAYEEAVKIMRGLL